MIDYENNLIQLLDKINLKGTIITGKVVIEDKFGNEILKKKNLVVLQGRAFVLKKLFCHPEIDMFKDKKILGAGNTDFTVKNTTIPALFTVGSAGNSGTDSIVNYTPSFSDKQINSLFADGVDIISDGANKGKKFSNVKYVNDTDKNESYVLLTLPLTGADFGNKSVKINEAGLLFGEASATEGEISSVTNLKLMSRLTFNDVTINPGDSFTVKYYLYA